MSHIYKGKSGSSLLVEADLGDLLIAKNSEGSVTMLRSIDTPDSVKEQSAGCGKKIPTSHIKFRKRLIFSKIRNILVFFIRFFKSYSGVILPRDLPEDSSRI